MNWIAGVDEFASETQLSEGWTYVLLPAVALADIEASFAHCSINGFHGKCFRKAQRADYEAFLVAIRAAVVNHPGAMLTFNLLERTWKAQFAPFARQLVAGSLNGAGVGDPASIRIAEHLFPGLITFQRLSANAALPINSTVDIQIDSDQISQHLRSSNASLGGKAIPTAKILGIAYEAYRKQQFPSSPPLGSGGIVALDDALSRAIQAADVFGNFALAYMFVELGRRTSRRVIKADIFRRVFQNELPPHGYIQGNASLAGPTGNDIQLSHQGALSLRIV